MAPAYLGDALSLNFWSTTLSFSSFIIELVTGSTIYIGDANERCPSLEQKLGTAVRCDVTKVFTIIKTKLKSLNLLCFPCFP